MKPKFIVNVSYDSLLVAYIGSTNVHTVSDTSYSHFSFLATCPPLEFAELLDVLIKNYDNHLTSGCSDFYTIERPDYFHRIIFTRKCATLSINRGGCSVLYMGSIDILRKLPGIIRKEYAKYDKKMINEAEELERES